MAVADLPEVNRITSTIIKAAIEVHRHLGPGLLESVYIACLAFELREAGLSVRTEQQLPVDYKGIKLGFAFRLDLVVNDVVIVEVKSIRALAPVHDSQLITYLKLTGCPAGLLINFNVPLLKNSLKRRLNPTPTL
jgi:GxxExxY protein